jgi:transposase InsO family protein
VRSDKGSLAKAKNLYVIHGADLQKVSVEEFLIAQFSFKGMTYVNVYDALKEHTRIGKVYREAIVDGIPESILCSINDLPSYSAIKRFLASKLDKSFALQKARMSRAEFDAANLFVRQNPKEFRVRGYLETDSTEIDVKVLRSDTGEYDRYWETHYTDFHSSLACGYYLTFNPNSESIALAGRNAIMGNQIKVATAGIDEQGESCINYIPIPNFMDVMDHLKTDWGKDFASRYTGQIFGKVDLEEDVRSKLNGFCQIHRSIPRHPQSKPHVERSFGVLNQFWKLLPGYTGSNYSGKPESLAREERQQLILTDIDFNRIYELAWNVYNNRPVRRLGGLSRVQYVLANTKFPKKFNEHVLDFLLLKVDKGRQHTIRRMEVTVNTIPYFSQELENLNGQKCTAYSDPQNAGYIHIYVENKYVTTAINREHFQRTQREALEFVRLRRKREKELNSEIKTMRGGLTHIQAKANAFMGMISNVALVKPEEIQQAGTSLNVLTTLEAEAELIAKAGANAQRSNEIAQNAKKKGTSLSLAAVNDRIK